MRTAVVVAAAALALSSPAARGQQLGPLVPYELNAFSTEQEGCFGRCNCPLLNPSAMIGTMRIGFAGTTGNTDVYTVANVSWAIKQMAPPANYRVHGSGVYYRTRGPTPSERMVLNVSFDGGPVRVFDTEEVTQGVSAFPHLNVLLSEDGLGSCYDVRMRAIASPRTGDWDGSGSKDVADVFAFLSAWFAGNGDYNADEQNDILDIFAFLTAWFGA